MADNREVLVLRGTLEGHSGWVTSLATCPTNPDILLSGSRDKTLIVWQLNGDDQAYGVPKKALKGHSHIVSDCKLSLDSEFALSSSWDKTVRLWNLKTGEIIKYAGHTSDVLSVDLSQNLRVIASASRDKTIKLWNIVGEEVATLEGHTDWVTSVRFVPGSASDIISASSDKLVKSWDLNDMKLTADFVGHTGYVTAITVSPDGSLCASAGKDGSIILWDFSVKKVLYTLDAKEEVHAVAFSPNRFWLCAATSKSIKIFHLEKRKPMDELKPEFVSTSTKARDPHCISLAWSADGQNLFSGYTDNVIRVWQVMTSSS